MQHPPYPSDPYEAARWAHTRLRRRLLDGIWRSDLEQRIAEHMGPVRRQGQGVPDLSANPYRVTCRELSTLYLSPPVIRHDLEAPAMTDERSAVVLSGLWAQARRYQTWVIGCREYMLRVHATEAGELRYRPVAPDMVLADSPLDTPDVPHSVAELRPRKHPKSGEWVWTWDYLDVSNPDAPVYRIHEDINPVGSTSQRFGADWSAAYGIGDEYPYRTAEGLPILPYVVHHAERVGDRLWDAYEGQELLEGSLTLAMLMSFWLHVVKDASWPQRWSINARPAGLELVDSQGNATRQEIVTDPAVLLVLEQIMEGLQPQVGQFDPGGDPKALLEAIEMYGARLTADAGVSASDVATVSNDPRSGYAISLTNDGKREAQRRFVSSFRDADERLMATSAILLNRATGGTLPESGYSVIYREIPLSVDELRGREESVMRRKDAGLLSRVAAYQELNPGITEEQARQDLAEIDAEDAAEDAAEPPEPEDTTTDQENDDG